MIDMAVGDQNPFNGGKIMADCFKRPLQCFEGDLSLYPRVNESPRGFVNKVRVHRFEWKRDGELDFVNSIEYLTDHDFSFHLRRGATQAPYSTVLPWRLLLKKLS